MPSRAPSRPAAPAVSVVVPTCRDAGRLGRALRSVRAQTWTDWDCWVVSDARAGASGAAALVESLGDARFRVIGNQAGGASAGRNLGIEQSRGAIVAFLDDDDVWLPRHLEGHLGRHAAPPGPAAVYSDTILVWEGDELPPLRMAPNELPEDPLEELRRGRFMIAGASCLSVDRRCLAEVGGFDVALSVMEDYDLVCRLVRRFPLRHLDEYATFYVEHGEPRLSTDSDLRLSDLRHVTARWSTPGVVHRLWARDRTCLQAVVSSARDAPLGRRLRELSRYGDVMRPEGVGYAAWAWRGIASRPRGFARLVLLALFGLRFHRLRRRFGPADAAAERLVRAHFAPPATGG